VHQDSNTYYDFFILLLVVSYDLSLYAGFLIKHFCECKLRVVVPAEKENDELI